MTPRYETPDPPGVVGTYGDAVIRWARDRNGVKITGWQAYALRKGLRYDANGDLLARIILWSTGRQNGKSVAVRSFNGWMLDRGRHLAPFREWTTMLAAAHDAKQARVIYHGVYTDFHANAELADETRLSLYKGIQSGPLTFDTVTSQPGSARGISAGAISWDEVLTQRDWSMWESLYPTQSAQRSPVMILTSTAGHGESVVLRAFYDRLVRIAAGDEKPDPSFYGAWWQSDDADAGLDWSQIEQANPAMLGRGPRLTRDFVRTEYNLLPPDGWRRERLNHFVDTVAEAAFRPGVWGACRVEAPPLDGLRGPYALGVGVTPSWDRATVAVAGLRPDGRVGVEVYRDLRGTVTARQVIDVVNDFPDPVRTIAFDAVSPGAASFIRAGEESGQEWEAYPSGKMVAATMDVDEMVRAGRIAHRDDLLDAQSAYVSYRHIGQDGAFRLSKSQSSGPVDAYEAAMLAAHAIAYVPPAPQIFFPGMRQNPIATVTAR